MARKLIIHCRTLLIDLLNYRYCFSELNIEDCVKYSLKTLKYKKKDLPCPFYPGTLFPLVIAFSFFSRLFNIVEIFSKITFD